ncbi:N-acetylglucosamine-binding protein GbpA [Andreprevotia chitinilytica]|uniref:N-acetylglucosamine-binding protein GbpA n=1 Tax=Andreprevotia chitinilytica TaxID=396808 RepID=UPI00068DD7F6|nr:N-acetylglucosamine-binding protein GbpA [Andreprevotia chitinilytica]
MKKAWLALSPLLACTAILLSQPAMAHGYMSAPKSRNLLCKEGVNVQCGAVQYEPQSVEGPDRYPETGPADGTLAAAGNSTWAALNEQTVDRWKRTDLNVGPNTFGWTFTAPHRSRDIRYFITKNGWNPNMPLTRAQFEAKPFCTIEMNNAVPDRSVTHTCNVPADHSGYHVILGAWDVADTAATFYNVADVNIKGGGGGVDPTPIPVPTWTAAGSIKPSENLGSGDKIYTRVFTASGENTGLSTSLTLTNATDGNKDRWPYLLATQINAEQSQYKAGAEHDGAITAVTGQNTVFAKADSGIVRVETAIDKAAQSGDALIPDDLKVTPKAQYTIVNGKAVIDGLITLRKKADVSVEVYNSQNAMVGTQSVTVDGTAKLDVTVASAVDGTYTLVVKARAVDDGSLVQKSFSTLLTGNPAPTPSAPAYVAGTVYKAGDLVSNGGKVYQCKPFPFSGWCGQAPAAYAPGTGSAWADAWTLQ